MKSELLGQLSVFTCEYVSIQAVCLFDGSCYEAKTPTERMKKLVPSGRYVVIIGEHPLVLQPTKLTESQVPEGHRFYHFQIGGIVYAGTFVGKEVTA